MDKFERFQLTQNILNDAKIIVDKLIIVAIEDGIISKDEQNLISVINENIRSYSSLLRDVLEDNIVDEDEIKQMIVYEEQLTGEVIDQAVEDWVITKDEEKILHVLFDCLRNLKGLNEL